MTATMHRSRWIWIAIVAGAIALAAIVAAGFGYQNDVDSSITVKVYDAVSGEVLSEDVYELSIKEDRNAARADGIVRAARA
mgnify:CR=1 FL=1